MINCSGISISCGSGLMPSYYTAISDDQIYEGLGIKQVKCEFCLSEYYFSKENTSCKNCGATYIEKNKY